MQTDAHVKVKKKKIEANISWKFTGTYRLGCLHVLKIYPQNADYIVQFQINSGSPFNCYPVTCENYITKLIALRKYTYYKWKKVIWSFQTRCSNASSVMNKAAARYLKYHPVRKNFMLLEITGVRKELDRIAIQTIETNSVLTSKHKSQKKKWSNCYINWF